MTAVDSAGTTQTNYDADLAWVDRPVPSFGDGYRPLVRRLVPRLVGDLIAVAAGLTVFDQITGRFHDRQAMFALAYVGIAAVVDFTHVHREWSRVEEVVLAMKAALIALVLTTAVTFLLAMKASRITFLTIALAMVVIRPVLALVLHRLERRDGAERNLVVVCSDAEYLQLLDAVRSRLISPLTVRARLSDGPVGPTAYRAETDWIDDLVRLCRVHRPWRLVIGTTAHDARALAESLAAVNEMGVQVRTLGKLFEEEFGRVPLVSLNTSWFLFDIGPLHNLAYRAARRTIDLIAGLVIGMVFVITVPFVAAAIRSEGRGPILFSQARVGQGGRIFQMVKFRTMRQDAELGGPRFAGRGDERVTRVGRVLRRTRIDEIPQFSNLLRGDMSIIGPRPERPEFVCDFAASIPFYEKRHLIKPGLTGWAQVHEGYGASVEDTQRKLERDLFYLKHQCFGLDLRIAAATMSSVVRFAGR
jgi:exopolysaccharide biosynthesis polyprenyl glycosylphosphotransferase